jgi:hypothetical protein
LAAGENVGTTSVTHTPGTQFTVFELRCIKLESKAIALPAWKPDKITLAMAESITVNHHAAGRKVLARSFLRLLSLVVHALPKLLLFHLESMQSLASLTMAARFNVGLLSKSFFRRSDIKLSNQHQMLKLVIAVVGNHSAVR